MRVVLAKLFKTSFGKPLQLFFLGSEQTLPCPETTLRQMDFQSFYHALGNVDEDLDV